MLRLAELIPTSLIRSIEFFEFSVMEEGSRSSISSPTHLRKAGLGT